MLEVVPSSGGGIAPYGFAMPLSLSMSGACHICSLQHMPLCCGRRLGFAESPGSPYILGNTWEVESAVDVPRFPGSGGADLLPLFLSCLSPPSLQ